MQSPKPFGGIFIIAVGDLFQLEPVYDTYSFQQLKNGFLPLATNHWIDLFKMFELHKIMRQADSIQFPQILNRLGEGCHTTEDIEILKQRLIKNAPNYPHDATHLMYKNSVLMHIMHSHLEIYKYSLYCDS